MKSLISKALLKLPLILFASIPGMALAVETPPQPQSDSSSPNDEGNRPGTVLSDEALLRQLEDRVSPKMLEEVRRELINVESHSFSGG